MCVGYFIRKRLFYGSFSFVLSFFLLSLSLLFLPLLTCLFLSIRRRHGPPVGILPSMNVMEQQQIKCTFDVISLHGNHVPIKKIVKMQELARIGNDLFLFYLLDFVVFLIFEIFSHQECYHNTQKRKPGSS